MKYCVIIETITSVEVEAETAAAAEELVTNQLLAQNPRQLFRVQAAEDVEIIEPADETPVIEQTKE